MTRFDFSWRCRDCGMTSRKEPHRRLSDHMMLAHGKVWNDDQNRYVPEDVRECESTDIQQQGNDPSLAAATERLRIVESSGIEWGSLLRDQDSDPQLAADCVAVVRAYLRLTEKGWQVT